MHGLYEVIDQGPASKEAREMSVEFISRNADDRRRLQRETKALHRRKPLTSASGRAWLVEPFRSQDIELESSLGARPCGRVGSAHHVQLLEDVVHVVLDRR
jgi:hypothetical protein